MTVERVDFVTIPTRDADRSRAWYRDMLGLHEDANNPSELTAGQLTLAFWNPESEGVEFSPNQGGIAFRVDDVRATCAALADKGADVAGLNDSGVCHMGFVRDPDGNWIILHRRYKAYGEG